MPQAHTNRYSLADALDSLPEKYPAVKSIVFFHFNDDKTTTQQAINWYIKEDTATIRAIRKRIDVVEKRNF